MTVVEDLAEIEARQDIGPAEKRRLKYHRKATAWKGELDTLPGRTFDVGSGPSRIRVTINYAAVLENGDLKLDISVWRGTNPMVPVAIPMPLIYRNPPILDGTFTENVAEVAKAELLRLVERYS